MVTTKKSSIVGKLIIYALLILLAFTMLVPFARVSCAKGGCEVRGEGEGCMVGANPNTNVLCESTEIPAIRYQVKKGHTVLESEVRYI